MYIYYQKYIMIAEYPCNYLTLILITTKSQLMYDWNYIWSSKANKHLHVNIQATIFYQEYSNACGFNEHFFS